MVGLARAAADGDQPDGGHVHAEPASSRCDKRDLHRDRDDAERARNERAAEQDLRAKRCGDSDAKPDDVRRRAGQERALVAHAGTARRYSR